MKYSIHFFIYKFRTNRPLLWYLELLSMYGIVAYSKSDFAARSQSRDMYERCRLL
jgi:hypothetical protein